MDTQQLRELSVRSIMSTDLIYVNKDSMVSEVNEKFESNDIHHIPVIDEDGQICGLISKMDLQLLKDWGSSLQLDSAIKKNQALMRSKLATDIMSKNVMSVSPETKLGFCADVFRENLFHSLPVVEDKKLVGIITTYDLLNVAFNETISLN